MKKGLSGVIATVLLSIAVVITGCGGGGGGSSSSTPTYTVGGTVSGLSGTVVLQNNGGDGLTITADGTFTFSTAIADGSAYSVTVKTQPATQTCSVANGTGTVSGANITDVTVTCSVNTYTVGGTVTGLASGETVVLQNNGGNDLAATADGSFTFATGLADGAAYAVTVKTHPGAQSCFVTNGSGTISGANVTNVAVNCYDSGTLDTSFDTDGIVVHNGAAGGNAEDEGYAITIEDNGKILVAGYSYSSSNYDMVIWRYNPDGTLDTSFDTDGIVVHDNAAGGSSDDYGYSITTDSSGKILVTGCSLNSSGNYDMVIWRYNPDGTLDTSFDVDGIVVHDNAAGGSSDDCGYSITTDSNGRILVAGYSYNSSDTDMVIWRYLPDGTLDTTFGTNGVVVHDSAAGGNSWDEGHSITTDSGSKILVTGFSYNGSNYDMVIWRYNSDGTLDTSFDTDGIVVHDNAAGGSGDDFGNSIITDADGKILVAGSSYNGSNSDMAIWRYNTDGTLDTTFGTGGIVIHDNAAGGSGGDYGRSITNDSNGKIVVTGNSGNGSYNDDMVIWRYNPDGTLDPSFDTDGIVVHNGAAGGNSQDCGYSITTDSIGKILVAGKSKNSSGNYDMVIWRYIP
ncbi:tyramine oxidase [bacterium BMS3Abin07]|nr:tyramine oxidase [bacterium BMS3Abin07]GBE33115.1 tyramine oxidase [bacterium BMS3Bbin05]